MAVRQYIGARYIPIFSDPIEWSAETAYEPLTVVTYQGGSYVSRQYVPAGIPLSNTDYWILWADYNAQLEAYRQEVLRFDGRINTAQTTADNAAASAANASNAVTEEAAARSTADSALQTGIDANAAAIEKLKSFGTAYNVLDYGAVGDGVTDDTQAFKDCLAALPIGASMYVPIDAGQEYRITETLTVTQSFVTIHMDAAPNLAWQYCGIVFEPYSADAALFDVRSSGVVFENILSRTPADVNEPTAGVFATAQNSQVTGPDVDWHFIHCMIVRYNVAIKHYDRGLNVRDCIIGNTTVGIQIRMTSKLPNQGDNTQRGIEIVDNRFHNGGTFIQVISSIPQGMLIQGNNLDLGAQLGGQQNALIIADNNSTIRMASIVDNVILNAAINAIYLDCFVLNSNITGNTIVGSRRAATGDGVYIKELGNSVISGNTIGGTVGNCLHMDIITGASISGNFLLQTSDTSNCCIRIGSRMRGAVIANNSCTMQTYNSNRYVITYDGTETIQFSNVSDNIAWGQSMIFMNRNSATLQSCKIQNNITD